MSSSMEEKLPTSHEAQLVSIGMDTKDNPVASHYSPFVSSTGFSGSLSLSTPGFSSDFHQFSFLADERC